MTNVRNQMGAWQLQFFEFSPDLQFYKYANSPAARLFKAHPRKWNPFKPAFRSRKFVCVITQERSAKNSKSGSTYDIKGVLCIFNNADELQHYSEQYWTAIKSLKTEHEKSDATCAFIARMCTDLKNDNREADFYRCSVQTAINLHLNTTLKETA